jgi:acetyl-CoA carboxylase carboxyl transferase subunit alpha
MEFEKEILEIEKKIEEVRRFADEKGIDLSSEIEKLIEEKEQKIIEAYGNLKTWDRVKLARHPKRPYTLDYIKYISEDFVELHGDRAFSDDPAIVGGICKIDGHKFMIIGTQKGRNLEENLHRSFGNARPEGYRKALRLMRLAERFDIPVLTLVDTAGAYAGLDAELRGQGEAIARNLIEMAGLETQIISVIIGEGGSGGALGLAVADRIYAMENSFYSVISPEGFATILYRDAKRAPEVAEDLKLASENLKTFGVVDDIIKEPLGGAHRNYEMAAKALKNKILEAYMEIKDISKKELVELRYNKFRNMGRYSEAL